jgi:hypothetical protein
MNPNRLNAAQLLMNYSAHENGRISQRICDSEFSQELQSVALATQQGEGVTPLLTVTPALPLSAADSGSGSFQADGQPLPTLPQFAPSGLLKGSANDLAESRTAKSSVNRAGTAARKHALSRKAQDSEQPALTNPLLLDRILAQLQLPAEARQRCIENLNTQGHLSLNAFLSILAGGTPGNPASSQPPVVKASDVKELLNSIQIGKTIGVPEMKDLKLKESGVYTLEEIRDLIRPLAQRQRRGTSSEAGRQPKVVGQAPSEGGAAEPLLGGPQAGVVPDGHVEQLSANQIPSFSGAGAARNSAMRRSLSADRQEKSGSPTAADRFNASSCDLDESDRRSQHIPHARANETAFEESNQPPSKPASGAQSFGSLPGSDQGRGSNLQASHPPVTVAQKDGAGVSAEPNIHGPSGLRPKAVEEQLHGVMTAALRMGEELLNEAPEGVEMIEDASADFQVDPPASGDHLFDSLGNTDSGSSSPDPQGQGNRADTFQANLDQDVPSGLNRSESDAVFRVPTPAGKSAHHAGAEEQARRVNVHEPDWARKVSEHVHDRARAGKSSLVVEFEPQDLGHMTLRIEADQRHVTAWISTQNEEARNLLLQNASALQKHLAEHGLSLGELTVNVSHDRGNARGHAENRESRRTWRVEGRQGRELQNEARFPGVHGRILGEGNHQTISLVV